VFPKAHVHLGWSSYAAVWLSRNPARIPGHFVPRVATGTVREAFERQAAEDWKAFLSLRAVELKPGGRLVVVLPGMDDEGVSGLEPVFLHANGALAQLVTEGAITAGERSRMVVGSYPRRRSELLAPFTDNQFHGLTLEHYELLTLPDAAWADYERDSNKQALATRHARFFRSIFAPSLAAAIADERKRSAFPDLLQEKLVRRLSDPPTPFHSFVQTIVLAKQGPAHDSAHNQ
jgi:SAM dependent carboxyl methyltransferase